MQQDGQSNFNNMVWFIGVVEDIEDPLFINRVRVRCIGYHSPSRVLMPIANLPWAPFISSTAQMSAPMVNQGDWVVGFFIDGNEAQQPVVLGTFASIPEEANPKNPKIGFWDPSGVHPKEHILNKGTNAPHARGEIGEKEGEGIDAVAYSQATTPTAIPVADGTKFSEPLSAFAAKYPFNHVIKTDGCHLIELDDTPEAERVQIFHKKGSFVEFHPDGTVVHRGNKDRFQAIFENENVYVGGMMNLSVVGDVNIISGGNTNISTSGDATWRVGGNIKMDVGGNFDVIVGGETNINSKGNLQLSTSGDSSTKAGGSVRTDAGTDFNVVSGAAVNIDASKSAVLYAEKSVDVGTSKVKMQTTSSPVSKPLDSVQKPSDAEIQPPEEITKFVPGVGLNQFELQAAFDVPEDTLPLPEYLGLLAAAGIKPPPTIVDQDGNVQLAPPENVGETSTPGPSSGSGPVASAPTAGNTVSVPAGGVAKDVKCGDVVLQNDYKKVKLSPNFTLADLTMGGSRKLPSGQEEEVLCNLVNLAVNILEPLKAAGIKFRINSAYRPPDTPLPSGSGATRVNPKSDHCKGKAVDLGIIGTTAYEGAKKAYGVVGKIAKQFLLEYNNNGLPGWVHIAYGAGGQKSALTLATMFESSCDVPGVGNCRNKLVDLRPNVKG